MPDFRETGQSASRARQFMPFAALKGYYDLVRQKERIPEPRCDLGEEDVARISRKLAQVRKGIVVRVTHYEKDSYCTTEGMVSQVNEVFCSLTVVKKRIAFSDILNIEGANIQEDPEL